MTDRIIYSQATQTGKMLAESVNDILVALASSRRVKALLDAASFGSDFASVATEVGGTLTVQNAQDLWTIFSNAAAAVDVPAVAELKRLDQG